MSDKIVIRLLHDAFVSTNQVSSNDFYKDSGTCKHIGNIQISLLNQRVWWGTAGAHFP